MSQLTVADLTFHYVEFGQGDEVVLFVHGNWCSARCWLPTLARLPLHYRTIALDQRGYGGSSKPATGYSIAQRAADLRDFADALGLSRLHLVGHSLGGAVATQFTLDNPGRLRSLFLLDPAPASGLPTNPQQRALQERFASDRAALAPALALAFGLPQHDPFFQALLDDAFAMARPSVQQNLDALAEWRVLDRLAELRLPTTIARGRNDLLISQAMAEEFQRRIADSHLHIFEGLGHSPNLEAPDRFVAALTSRIENAQ